MMQRENRSIIGELPVVDDAGKIRGHIAIKDLVAMNFV